MNEYVTKPGAPVAFSSFTPVHSGIPQRQCACSATLGLTGERTACRQKREAATLQWATSHAAVKPAAPPIVYEVLRSPGQPLDATTRAFMESRFGHDFSGVRVHTNPHAAESAQAVNALADTVGREIVFGTGQYEPERASSSHLLAHELAHVVQQSGAEYAWGAGMAIGQADSQQEALAETAARNVVNGASLANDVGRVSLMVQRYNMDNAPYGDPKRDSRLRHELDGDQNAAPAGSPIVYMCSKPLDTSPFGSHAFFRTGNPAKGNPTLSLQPVDTSLGADCWQGVPDHDYPSDKNTEGACEPTAISVASLEQEFGAYPIGHYCTWGPNSNTFVGHIARRCGIANPDPPGWTPGIDASPPPSGTYAPNKWETLTGCTTKLCVIGPDSPQEPIA